MRPAWKLGVLLVLVLAGVNARADQYITSMKIYMQLNPPNYAKAIEQGEEGIKIPGDAKNWEIHALLAECYAVTGRYQEAGKEYQTAMALDPAKKNVILKGDGKYIQGLESHWDLAFYTGADLVKKASYDKVSLSDLALSDDMKGVIKDNGQPEEVRQGTYLIQGAPEKKPMVVFTYWTKGLDFSFLDGKTFRRSTLKDTTSKDYLVLAANELKGAAALDPDNAKAYEILSVVYDLMGPEHKDEKMAMLLQAVKTDPQNAQLHVALATAYEMDGKNAEAAQEFKQATTLADSNSRAWAGLGETQLNLKKYAEATVAFKRATELDSTNKDVFFNMGMAYFNLEDYANSLKAFQRALAKDPTDGDAWAFSGHCAADLKDEKAAIGYYEKAVSPDAKLSPEYAYMVWQNLCILYTRNNLKDKAEAACKKAKELTPQK
jgi:tetratricopeptide (TPR) repeat protein